MAGVLAGAAEALLIQGYPVEDVAQGLLSGYDFAEDPVVNQLLNYGGMDGMASILTMLMFAAAFGGIIKKLGVIDCLLGKIFGDSGNVFRIITSSAIVHAVCFVVTGNYYAINSILALSQRDLRPSWTAAGKCFRHIAGYRYRYLSSGTLERHLYICIRHIGICIFGLLSVCADLMAGCGHISGCRLHPMEKETPSVCFFRTGPAIRSKYETTVRDLYCFF